MQSSNPSESKTQDSVFAPAKRRQRFLALDVLRGLTIALMILVNTPGSWSTIYAPFKHASWHGFTITDLVFPTFLFVVGNAMSFSMRKFKEQGNAVFVKKVFKRSFLIFLIGLFLSAFPFFYRSEGELVLKELTSMRIMGVLQRIALCYLFASFIVKYLKLKGAVFAGILILLAYWGVMYYFGDPTAPYSLKGNAALKFDLLIFPAENLWRGFGVPFDPEGLLSTLPAIVNVIAGYVAGIYIQRMGNNFGSVLSLVAIGTTFVLLGEIWDISFPVNKPIWTSSYVLLTIGWDLIIIGGLIYIIEVASLKKWTYFFEVFGKNPLFIFVMSGVFVMLMNIILIDGSTMKSWIYQHFYQSWLTDYNASLLFAVTYVFLLWLMGYCMDRKKMYIKV